MGQQFAPASPSRIQLEIEVDFQLGPSLPDEYQDNDQQQDDHVVTILSTP